MYIMPQKNRKIGVMSWISTFNKIKYKIIINEYCKRVKDSKKSNSRTIRLYMSKVKFEDILFTESKIINEA